MKVVTIGSYSLDRIGRLVTCGYNRLRGALWIHVSARLDRAGG